ncbi:phosphotransferase [Actinomadura fibrosa]|uniref:Phosphotransferase n=1 Tax=Actinomadura fibrosa TaxID=111802 RepID=A0ABW2XBW5_9ACTN|nr:phosphotransferase [Actinomadura fibrosa]
MTTTWTKTYTDLQTRRTAAANHQWLTQQMRALSTPMQLARLQQTNPRELTFDYVFGHHARPRDLVMIAGTMGHFHQAVHRTALHQARLDRPFRADPDLSIPDFIAARRDRIRAHLKNSRVPAPALTADQAVQAIEAAADAPASIYADANLRNLLVDGSRVTMVDYDCLTLAPFGYDLAKLIVSLAMTHGPLRPVTIGDALTAYNHALTAAPHPLPVVPWRELMQWTEIHHILTSPYLGRHCYRHSWHQTRPTPHHPPRTD